MLSHTYNNSLLLGLLFTKECERDILSSVGRDDWLPIYCGAKRFLSHGLSDSGAILRALRSWHEFWATTNDKSRSIRLYIAMILPKTGSWCAERGLALLTATVRSSWPNSGCRYCLISNIPEYSSPGLRTSRAPCAVAPLIKSSPTVSWSSIYSLRSDCISLVIERIR